MNKENFAFLVIQHDRSLKHVDSLDLKISQTIAASIIVLSFIFDKGNNAKSLFLFYSGLILILGALGLLILNFMTKTLKDGLKPEYFRQGDKQLKRDLEIQLPKNIERNIGILAKKSEYFNWALKLIFIGIILLVGGYYI